MFGGHVVACTVLNEGDEVSSEAEVGGRCIGKGGWIKQGMILLRAKWDGVDQTGNDPPASKVGWSGSNRE